MKKILLVDDSELFYKFIEDVLKKEDFEIIWARNGKEAIEKFNEYNPDLILVDVILSDTSGIDLIKDIKKLNERARIIVISGLDKNDVIREALEAGAKDYIVKGIAPKLFREKIINNLE